MQFEMGMSTSRYLPARGTAGLDRSRVIGNSRVPCPPPMMMESTLLVFADMREPFAIEILSCELLRLSYTLRPGESASDNGRRSMWRNDFHSRPFLCAGPVL